tara:strand:- start:89021 stop:89737 length:717 start_codon:yes stop_codon:yes gene_type:complete
MRLVSCIIFSLIIGCTNPVQNLSGSELLEKSKRYHDPNGSWEKARLSVHIQEPRLGNPLRYSEIRIDNENEYFELNRKIDEGIVSRIIEKGEARVLLNGSENISTEIMDEYRLSEDRNTGYYGFYSLLYGLPMSLNLNEIEGIGGVKESRFNGKDVFKIEVRLKEAIISDIWVLYINKSSYVLEGIELIHNQTDMENERIVFEDEFEFDGIRIPRFRHWYRVESNEYRGSDIIVKKTK